MPTETAALQSDPQPDVSDAALIRATRSGDSGAYGILWKRHHQAALRTARASTSTFDADDLVQESFAAVYLALTNGNGPVDFFRSYLLTTVRNTAASWGRTRREVPADDIERMPDPMFSETEIDRRLDRSLTIVAFKSLPARCQTVLWHTEVEGRTAAELATVLGMTPNAAAQLAFRAREKLRQAWIRAHLRSLPDAQRSDICAWALNHAPAHRRGTLCQRSQTRLDRHVAECTRCVMAMQEADLANLRLTRGTAKPWLPAAA